MAYRRAWKKFLRRSQRWANSSRTSAWHLPEARPQKLPKSSSQSSHHHRAAKQRKSIRRVNHPLIRYRYPITQVKYYFQTSHSHKENLKQSKISKNPLNHYKRSQFNNRRRIIRRGLPSPFLKPIQAKINKSKSRKCNSRNHRLEAPKEFRYRN